MVESTTDTSVSNQTENGPDSAISDAYINWPCAVRRGVSLWLIYHILGLVICPASLMLPGALTDIYVQCYSHYLQPIHQMQGHSFFAPQPAAAHVIQYEIELKDKPTSLRQFPLRDEIHPRLMYHRYFMLAERLSGSADEERELLIWSYARHLGTWYSRDDLIGVRVFWMRHNLLGPVDVLDGNDINNEQLYEILEEYAWTREELGIGNISADNTTPASSSEDEETSLDTDNRPSDQTDELPVEESQP